MRFGAPNSSNIIMKQTPNHKKTEEIGHTDNYGISMVLRLQILQLKVNMKSN